MPSNTRGAALLVAMLVAVADFRPAARPNIVEFEGHVYQGCNDAHEFGRPLRGRYLGGSACVEFSPKSLRPLF